MENVIIAEVLTDMNKDKWMEGLGPDKTRMSVVLGKCKYQDVDRLAIWILLPETIPGWKIEELTTKIQELAEKELEIKDIVRK